MPIIEIKKVKQAGDLLKKGELVVYPTETAYALGGDSLNKKTVEKIYEVKGRDNKKPLAVIASDLSQVIKFFLFNKTAFEFAKKYWPGPVTLLLPYKNKKLGLLNTQGKTVGVRVSSNKIARKLAEIVGNPIVSTSANISGKGTAYSRFAIYKQLHKQAQNIYFLNSGTLSRRATSAMVEVKDNSVKVFRSNPVLKK